MAFPAEWPPDDVIAGELEFFPEWFDNSRELGLIVNEIDQRLIGVLFALPEKDAPAVGKDAVRAKRMRRVQLLLRLRVRVAHRTPAHTGANERINEAQLEKIAKAKRELIVNWAKFALPDSI